MLVESGGIYSLIYVIDDANEDDPFVYIGKNPMQSLHNMNNTLKNDWSKVDPSISAFYLNVHDGFNDHTSTSMGLDNVLNINSMDDFDWEFADEIHLDMKNIYNFFSNGMGQYVAVNLSQPLEKGTYLWSNDDLPQADMNFWDVVDEWLVIGLQS